MPSPFESNTMDPYQPQSPVDAELPPSKPGRQTGNATIYQTTGPDAHTGPIFSPVTGGPALNPRSCVTCRRRKVRCDKQMPCSNCRRALIPCIFPAPGRAPRQQKPKDPNAPPKSSSQREAELVKRLRKLEGIVEELSGQIDVDGYEKNEAPDLQRAATFPNAGHPGSAGDNVKLSGLGDVENPLGANEVAPTTTSLQRNSRPGRMVLSDQRGAGRYVSSGFWSKMNDEINAIRAESYNLTDDDDDASDWEESTTGTPGTGLVSVTDHHGFILGYRSLDVDLAKCHPVPAHATYLWSVFQENVEPLLKIVHMPTMENILRDARRSADKLSPGNEALVFAIYFSAITALEADEIETNLGVDKEELLAQYRFATEQALAKANYLTTSDFAIVQALTLFLIVVRRHDDSRFCWTLTSLAVRIAQGMGIHRDGTEFGLSPFDTEMRRRVWWALMSLDLRSAEEHGTDLAINDKSFDTHMPSNINDVDLSIEIQELPPNRDGWTDSSVARVRHEICFMARKIHITSSALASGSHKTDLPTLYAKEQMLVDIYEMVNEKFLLPAKNEDDSLVWVTARIVRIIMAKNALIIYHPLLFPGAEQQLSSDIRQRLFISAIEVLECSYLLISDPRSKQYRWLFKTYSSLHALAYTLIEICRRPWTPLVERGWLAAEEFEPNPLHYTTKVDQAAVFLPLKRLFTRARKHRQAELKRLQGDLEEARRLDFAERMNPAQVRFGPIPGTEDRMDQIREDWRRLVRPAEGTPAPFPSSRGTPAATSEAMGSSDDGVFTRTPADSLSTSDRPAMPMGTAIEYVGELLTQPNIIVSDFWQFSDVEMNPKAVTSTQNLQMTAQADQMNPAMLPLSGKDDATMLWPDNFGTMDVKFDDIMADDTEMLGEGFNWQDWGHTIRGMELQSTPMLGGEPNPNQQQQWAQ